MTKPASALSISITLIASKFGKALATSASFSPTTYSATRLEAKAAFTSHHRPPRPSAQRHEVGIAAVAAGEFGQEIEEDADLRRKRGAARIERVDGGLTGQGPA